MQQLSMMLLFHPICHLDSVTGGKTGSLGSTRAGGSTFTFRAVSRMQILSVSPSWTGFALQLPFFILIGSHQTAFAAKTLQRIMGSQRAFD